MKSCEICGSYAINEGLYERERGIDSNLCDPHYWQKRAKDLQAQLSDLEKLKLDIANALTSIAEYDQENTDLKAQLFEAKQATRWESDLAGQALVDLEPYRKDAERYLKLRRMAVELSLSHQVISQFVTNQSELDAAIQAVEAGL